MEGLMQRPQNQPQENVPQEGQPNEEQEAYNQFVTEGVIKINAEDSRDQVIESLKGPDPVQSVASVTLMIVDQLTKEAQEQGVEFSEAVRLHGGMELMEVLITIGTAAGALPEFTDAMKEEVSHAALDAYYSREFEEGRMGEKDIADAQALTGQAEPQEMPEGGA